MEFQITIPLNCSREINALEEAIKIAKIMERKITVQKRCDSFDDWGTITTIDGSNENHPWES